MNRIALPSCTTTSSLTRRTPGEQQAGVLRCSGFRRSLCGDFVSKSKTGSDLPFSMGGFFIGAVSKLVKPSLEYNIRASGAQYRTVLIWL